MKKNYTVQELYEVYNSKESSDIKTKLDEYVTQRCSELYFNKEDVTETMLADFIFEFITTSGGKYQ